MIINWQLAKHPMNYLIVTLMLIIAGIAGHFILSLIGATPAKPPLKSSEQNTPATTPVQLRSDGAFAAISVGM